MILDHRRSDIKRLNEILDPEKHDIDYRERAGFQGMLNYLATHKNKELTPRQREWLQEVEEKLGCDTPPEEYMFSSGKVPRESYHDPHPVPDVLLKPLPMKPPGRK